MKLTSKDLADGRVLAVLVDRFYEKKTEGNLTAVLRCLRDSTVYCPMGEKGPELLNNHDGAGFLPVFSCEEEIPEEYREGLSMEKKHFMDCVSLYRADKEKTMSGIVLNPFGRSMILDYDLIGYIFTLPSQIGKE